MTASFFARQQLNRQASGGHVTVVSVQCGKTMDKTGATYYDSRRMTAEEDCGTISERQTV